jgi:hypothetical protein
MSFYTYIVSWDLVHNNVIEMEKNFSKFGNNFSILNSESTNREGWENIGDIRYFRQFRYALEHFDQSYDYMGWIAGDVSFDKWGIFLNRINDVFKKYNFGIYAPNLTTEYWNKEKTFLKEFDFDNNLIISSQSDGIAIYINKKIVKILIEYFNYLENKVDLINLKSGWGMDFVWCSLSMYLNLPVVRDIFVTLDHPEGSSYDHSNAFKELDLIKNTFIDFCNIKKYNTHAIKHYIKKMSERSEKMIDLEEFYVLPIIVEKDKK